MKGHEDIYLFGTVIEKKKKIINDCVEKKLTLSKLQSSMWEKTNNNDDGGGFSITDLGVDDAMLKTLIEKDASKSEGSYKMKK
jgi:hypothetical protein